MQISGILVDVFKRKIISSSISISRGRIKKIKQIRGEQKNFILPGFIDSHIHIESSMLTPGSFARAIVPHGTIGVVSDPHEIANVLGINGVNFMIRDSKKVPTKFWFGAPSCVPATNFETSGGKIGIADTEKLLQKDEIKYLSEMMNYPGVINQDPEVMQKIKTAQKAGKKIDGHAPGLSGEGLRKYVESGISTDHECSTIEEAREKISLGMKILIREGSSARNLEALKYLFKTNPEEVMLCSDDLHPEMLQKRHINKLVANLINEGYDIYDVIRSATVNPVMHYGLEAGLLRKGDPADFIIVDSLEEMNVIETWINGKKIYERGKVLFDYKKPRTLNYFNCSPLSAQDIMVKNNNTGIRIIRAYDGELLTKGEIEKPGKGNTIEASVEKDILKIIVKDRYKDSNPAIGFIRGFGLKAGAFASSVAHDSHNIIAIGTNDKDIISAVNEVIKFKGGMAVAAGKDVDTMALDIAGIMTTESCKEVASKYELLSEKVRRLGCSMSAPFMTLSFMALLVIPELKLSDKGLFDGKKFCHVPLYTG